jgi:hypothetical protein
MGLPIGQDAELYPAGQLLVLVLDHEELITLSRLEPSQAARHPGHAGHEQTRAVEYALGQT